MPSQPPPGSTGGSPWIPAALPAEAVRRVVDFFKINGKLRPVTGAAVSSPLAGMPSQPPPSSTSGSPRTPAPFQSAPGSTAGVPKTSAALSDQIVHRIPRKCTVLVDWWLERVEGEEGKIRVAGETFTPQMRKGASSSNMKVAGRVFRSSAIVKRHDYTLIESEDGYQIRLGCRLNIPKTRENGFSEEVCESFDIGFPDLWQRLVNPKMVPDNEHPRSPSEITTGPPSSSVEDYMAYFLSGSFSSKIRYDFKNDFDSSVGCSGSTDGLTTQSPSNLPDDNAGNITASFGLYGLIMGVPEKPLAPPGEACNSGQENYQHESTQIDASKQETVNRSISSVSGSISSNLKVDGNILAPSKISSVVNEGYRSREGADIQQENMHSCSSEHGMVTAPIDCTSSQLGEPGIPKSGKDSVNLGTTDALELPTEGMTPKFGAIRGSEYSTGRKLRSGKVLEMPSVGPMKRGHKQQESSSKQMVNQGATSNADLTSHENDFSAAEVAVEQKLESHDLCRKGRGRLAEGKGKRKRK